MGTIRRKDSKNRVLKNGEYERSNHRYEYRWTDSMKKRHSIYADTLPELREKEQHLIRDMYVGIQTDSDTLTINDLYEKWKVLKKGLKPNTFENYKYLYEMFVRDMIGDLPLKNLKKSDIRAFYNTLHEVRGLKVNTVDNVHTVLHQVLEIGVEDEYLHNNPSNNAISELKRAYAHERGTKKSLTVEEEELFLGYLRKPGCKYHHWYPLMVTMIYTGMRIGEVAGLRWQDVDFENNYISVNHDIVYYCSRDEKAKHGHQKWGANTPKTEAGKRLIPMLPIVKEALLMEKEYQNEVGIECRQIIGPYTNFIFVNRNGDAQHQGTVNKAIRRIVRDCNMAIIDKEGGVKEGMILLPNFSCHSLRHTMSTRMKEAGVDDLVRRTVLGHKSLDITDNVYTHIQVSFSQKELQKLTTNVPHFYDK
ncbi:MAG: site-specific integrase [Solobacterium sp.]|nr:site-specific integrase [Solobacterium sp.]